MGARCASVGDCEHSQTAWNCALALAGGGSVWEDSGLKWSWQAHDGQVMLNFPLMIEPAAVVWRERERWRKVPAQPSAWGFALLAAGAAFA